MFPIGKNFAVREAPTRPVSGAAQANVDSAEKWIGAARTGRLTLVLRRERATFSVSDVRFSTSGHPNDGRRRRPRRRNSGCNLTAGDRIMKTGKRSPSDLDLTLGAFQVWPNWYQEYWLEQDRASPTPERPQRWRPALYSALGAGALSLVAMFVGGN
jgi:hypothetical protein